MSVKSIAVRISICIAIVTSFSLTASAYCDLLVYSGGGRSDKEDARNTQLAKRP